MHLLAATQGQIDDGGEALDLGQSPGDILVLSAADTELAGLAGVVARSNGTGEGQGPTIRLANYLKLSHPMSVDVYAERMIPQAKLVIVRLLGGEEAILALIDFGALDAWGVLTLVIALIFLMGFFFDVLEILLIALPIFGPIVAPLEFGDHIAQADVVYWFAILVAITLQTSFLTPPMGLSLFYIKGVAPKGISMRQIYLGIIPFVVLQMACVALVMWQPGLVVSLPQLLFESKPY